MTGQPDLGRFVVFTCVTAGYDIPLESPWALRCPHVCFTDDPALTSATWEMRLLDGADLDPARRSRLPKILAHRYLPDFETSLWIDASARLLEDPVALARRALDGADFAAPRHPRRTCAYDEIAECARRGKDAAEPLQRQADAYRAAGLPEGAGLWEATILVRRH
ncbi:MAG TPA: glycosyltransferase domain-containing protein, partial [Nevskiaceae bacterium]|nr:glycosyltransferase domain-containing protein [Nevskiaceae bacterium]